MPRVRSRESETENPKSNGDGWESDDDKLGAACERDLFDSPCDSWRDLENREALDEIDGEPIERVDHQ